MEDKTVVFRSDCPECEDFDKYKQYGDASEKSKYARKAVVRKRHAGWCCRRRAFLLRPANELSFACLIRRKERLEVADEIR